jgi:hypothetical protein
VPTWRHTGRSAATRPTRIGYDPDGASIIDPDGVGPAIGFLRVPEGKTAKNRMHIDIRVAVGGQARRRARRHRRDREIARALRIGDETVKTHVSSVLAKLGLADRTQAAIYALRRGLVR